MAGRRAGLHYRGPNRINPTEQRPCLTCGISMTIGGRKGRPKRTRYCSLRCVQSKNRRERTCLMCGAVFVRRGQGQPKYCSLACTGAHRRRTAKNAGQKCSRCSVEFYATTKRVYCGDACRIEAMRARRYVTGESHPLYKGSGILGNGYAWVLDPSGARTNAGKPCRRYTHIVIMERALGRRINPGEVVHHLNGVKHDNRPENLLVLTSSEHRQVHHWYSEEYQREHDAIGDLRDKTLAFLESLRAESEEKMAI